MSNGTPDFNSLAKDIFPAIPTSAPAAGTAADAAATGDGATPVSNKGDFWGDLPKIGRIAGQDVTALAEGAADIPGAVWNLPALGWNAVRRYIAPNAGMPEAPYLDIGGMTARALNLPQPQSPQEQLGFDVLRGVGGALGTAGGGAALEAANLGPTAAAIGRALAAQPVRQAVTAGTLGAAQDVMPPNLSPEARGLITLGLAGGAGAIGRGGGPRVTGPVPDPADIRAIGDAYYGRIARSSGTLDPQFTNDFIDSIQAGLPQTPGGMAVRGTADPVTDLRARLETLRGQPLGLQEVQEMDQQLSRAINGQWQNGRLTPDGRGLLEVQQNLRNRIDGITQADVTGGNPAAFADMANARQAWTQFRKADDLQNMWTRAQDTDNPATSLRTQIRTLVNNPKAVRGYSDDEVDALRDSAARGLVGNTINLMGSRLLPLLGLGEHGPFGFLGGQAVAELSRRAMSGIQGGRVEQAMRVFGAGAPPAVAPAQPLGLQTTVLPTRAQTIGKLLLSSPLASMSGQ